MVIFRGALGNEKRFRSTPPDHAGGASLPLIASLRPLQWTKNLVVFAGLIFSGNLADRQLLLMSMAAFCCFCVLSGATYLINDVLDIEQDRKHPQKRHRPIAAGKIPKRRAVLWAIVLGVIALACAFLLNRPLGWIAAAYFFSMLLYSAVLKHLVIVDVVTIAVGFALRAIAGAVVIEVLISPWLVVCTLLLASFLALGKRRTELVILDEQAEMHRPTLSHYNPRLLDQMISVVTASTLVAYAIYTIAEETVAKFETSNLMYTIPFVMYGIFRYLYLIYQRNLGGNPEQVLLRDKPLIINVLFWIIAVTAIIYLFG